MKKVKKRFIILFLFLLAIMTFSIWAGRQLSGGFAKPRNDVAVYLYDFSEMIKTWFGNTTGIGRNPRRGFEMNYQTAMFSKEGAVKNEIAAIEIAKAVLKAELGIFFDENQSLQAVLEEKYNVWVISAVKESYGRIPHLAIKKDNAQILALWYTTQ